MAKQGKAAGRRPGVSRPAADRQAAAKPAASQAAARASTGNTGKPRATHAGAGQTTGKQAAARGAGNQRELAARFGVSQPAVVKWLRDDRWTFGRGPWTAEQVEQIRTWRAAHLSPDPAAPDAAAPTGDRLDQLSPERRAKVAVQLERAKAIRLDREIKEKVYHRVDECERRQMRLTQAVRDALLNVAAGLPFEADVRAVVQDEIEKVLRMFAGEG